MRSKMLSYIRNNKWRIACMICISATTMIYQIAVGVREYIGDSYYYWIKGQSVFFVNNGFNILNFPETFRGYFFPTILAFFQWIAVKLHHSDIWGWRLLSSLNMAVLFGYVLPEIFGKQQDNWRAFIRNNLCFLFFLYLWKDFIVYPLSDVPAVLSLLIVALSLKKIKSELFKADDIGISRQRLLKIATWGGRWRCICIYFI